MQTKKEEIRDTILEAAQKEFLIHGYEGSSMRTIAKKANTTIGNIYHYFSNKEAILEVLMEEPIQSIHKVVDNHMQAHVRIYSYDELKKALDEIEDIIDDSDLMYLMDERLLILFDLKTTRFVEIRDWFVKACKQHLAWHLGVEDSDSAYVDILTNTFISCVRHILLEHKDVEQAKQEFGKVFKMLCAGLITDKEEV